MTGFGRPVSIKEDRAVQFDPTDESFQLGDVDGPTSGAMDDSCFKILKEHFCFSSLFGIKTVGKVLSTSVASKGL